ncbi:MAG: transcriptional repressor [Deltaproteobacteria bacterium]|nr:transcriptional repressor [Deltaproteobacteria bacterium]
MTNKKSIALLRKRGLKVTRQRTLLLNAILESDPVFSTTALEEKVSGHMDVVTIYRILAIFLQHSIVRKVVSNDVTRFYELTHERNPNHPHFVCTKCKRITCLKSMRRQDNLRLQKYALENEVQDISIQFTGICADCKNSKTTT